MDRTAQCPQGRSLALSPLHRPAPRPWAQAPGVGASPEGSRIFLLPAVAQGMGGDPREGRAQQRGSRKVHPSAWLWARAQGVLALRATSRPGASGTGTPGQRVQDHRKSGPNRPWHWAGESSGMPLRGHGQGQEAGHPRAQGWEPGRVPHSARRTLSLRRAEGLLRAQRGPAADQHAQAGPESKPLPPGPTRRRQPAPWDWRPCQPLTCMSPSQGLR